MDNIEYINTEKSYYTKPLRLTRKGLGYFEKIVLLSLIFIFAMMTIYPPQNESYAATQKVMWGKTELKPGKLGKSFTS